MTILGMAPELLGESDSRMDEKSLFHPNQRRIGGNVKLTIDADLQNFIEDLLIENGYMDSSVMVSNFQTGEVEAAVCLGGDSSETVFSRKFHPASTMKLAIAASALEYDAKLANFRSFFFQTVFCCLQCCSCGCNLFKCSIFIF